MVRQATGTEIISGMKKGILWGTAVALGTGNGVYILSESIEGAPEVLFDESLGNAFTKCADLGNIAVEGDLEAMVKYEGLLLPFALCMGTAGLPALVTNGYKHVLKCADNIDGLFATYASDKALKVHEIPSLKIASFSIEAEAGDYIKVTFSIIGNIIKDDSIINTSVTMASVTYLMKCGNIVFNNGKILLKDFDGSAPSDPTDRVQLNSFSLEFNRNIEGDYVASGSREILEPQQTGQPEINVTLGFPRYTDSRFIQDLFSKQYHELIATWEGDLIGAGPDKYTFGIELPKLVIIDSNVPIDDLGKMPFEVNYKALQADTPPAGFSDNGPLNLVFINSIATDPLV
jgi:hypothetical protein